MNQKVVETMKCYLSEFRLFVDDHFVTFNIDTVKNVITVAVSKLGKVSLCSFDSIRGDKGLFFEYGVMCEQIAINDFSTSESRGQASLHMTERGRKIQSTLNKLRRNKKWQN